MRFYWWGLIYYVLFQQVTIKKSKSSISLDAQNVILSSTHVSTKSSEKKSVFTISLDWSFLTGYKLMETGLSQSFYDCNTLKINYKNHLYLDSW